MKIDTNLSWQYHVNNLSVKLNRANALLFKMRKHVSCKILRSIYFAILDSYLSYCCLVWAQNFSTIPIQWIVILQKRLLELLIFNQGIFIPVTCQTKLHLKISRQNLPRKYFICQQSLNNLSPLVFNKWFSFSSDQHNYETWSSTQGNLKKLFYKTIDMGSIH